MLKVYEKTCLALDGEAVHQLGYAQHFRSQHVAPQMAASPIGGRIRESLSLHPSGIVGGQLQTLDVHGHFPVPIPKRETSRPIRQLRPEAPILPPLSHNRAPSPTCRSRPKTPASASSMAQAIVAPVEMVSKPNAPHRRLASRIT